MGKSVNIQLIFFFQNVKNTITNKINFFDTLDDQISAIDNQLRKV
jgi:hypothetical protein